jgi:hypothetical protein
MPSADGIADDPWNDKHSLKDLARGMAFFRDRAAGLEGGINERRWAAKAETLSEVLQARTVIESARTNRHLVYATWTLVAVTAVSAAVFAAVS